MLCKKNFLTLNCYVQLPVTEERKKKQTQTIYYVGVLWQYPGLSETKQLMIPFRQIAVHESPRGMTQG